MSVVNVKWGRERLVVPLPPSDAKLSSFRETLAERTHLPPNGFKLLHAGAVMKDDNVPISSYNIRPGATIVLLDSSPAAAPSAPTPAKAPKTEQSTIDQIRSELASVKGTLEPGVDAFLRALSPTPTSTASAPTVADADADATQPSRPNALDQILNPTDDPATQHTRLGELLLQALLRLDAIGIESGWTDARAERKGAVRTVQGVLDRLDGGWKAAKAKVG
ncbi:hypothetical protein OF83DRAFT_1057040 [Amylostereum chailletii]|nr:hypothetical protein OF83DRAFT_1057040 [Amylostereum chailletii]